MNWRLSVCLYYTRKRFTMTNDLISHVKLLKNDPECNDETVNRYVNHSSCLNGTRYEDLIDEIKININKEIQHAIFIVSQIIFLEGLPPLEFSPAIG